PPAEPEAAAGGEAPTQEATIEAAADATPQEQAEEAEPKDDEGVRGGTGGESGGTEAVADPQDPGVELAPRRSEEQAAAIEAPEEAPATEDAIEPAQGAAGDASETPAGEGTMSKADGGTSPEKADAEQPVEAGEPAAEAEAVDETPQEAPKEESATEG